MREELIDKVVTEIQRIFPDDIQGYPEEYQWLEENYGVTEEDDVKWIDIINYSCEDYDDCNLDDEDNRAFLESDTAVCEYLTKLLQKYQGNTVSYPSEQNS